MTISTSEREFEFRVKRDIGQHLIAPNFKLIIREGESVTTWKEHGSITLPRAKHVESRNLNEPLG